MGGNAPPSEGRRAPPGNFVLAYVTRDGYRLHCVQIWTKLDKKYGRESAKSVLTLIRSVLSAAEHFCTIFCAYNTQQGPLI